MDDANRRRIHSSVGRLVPSKLETFLAKLKRRRVYHVAVAYIVVGLGVLGAAELILEPLGLDNARPFIVVFTLLGFPLALVLAWAYDITPEGIERTGDSEGEIATTGTALEGPPAEKSEAVLADTRRLAILPFANIHADRDADYFADGMTEELISVISRIHGLDVIARTSVMAYRDTTKSVTEIGRELNVGSVLEGSVRKEGDQLRITAQLIDVGTQGHLWSSDYDREIREVFKVQADVARNVAEALEITLLGAEEARIGRAPTGNLEAYDLYLVGRHHLNKRTDTGLRKAIEQFGKAAALDPSFALAYAGLADAYVLAGIGYAAIPDALSHANDAAIRALELDNELSEAHTALGYVRLNRDWDWEAAEAEFGRAIELNPSNAQAHQWHAHVALYRRRLVEADRRADRARALDPLSVLIQNESGWPAYFRGDYGAAMERYQQAAAMDPSFAMAHFNMGNIHEAEGRLDEAIRCFQRAVDLSDRMAFSVSCLGAALARAGKPDEARPLLEELRAQGDKGAALSVWIAALHEALGERTEAVAELERALERREPILTGLDAPWLPFTSLRDEPRYEKVLQDVSEHWGWGMERPA